MNFVFRRHEDNRRHGERIRAWVREAFGLGEDSAITVMEIRCADPDCPPHATVIGLLDVPGQAKQYQIYKPMAEVLREEVFGLSPP